MKKLILATTLMVLPVLANAAEAPKVKLGGRMDTMAGYVKQKDIYLTTNPALPINRTHSGAIINDTTLDVNIDGISNQGFKYGGLIRLHADASDATNKETTFGDKTMFYIQHDKIGRFEAGNTPGAGGLFEMDLTFFNRGSWGVDGFWSQWVTDRTYRVTNLANKANFGANDDTKKVRDALRGFNTRGLEFVVSPNLPSNYSGHYYSDAPKASFFTKPISQLTLGVSYIPDMDSTGSISGQAPRSKGPVFDSTRTSNPATFREIISGGGILELDPSKELKIKTSLVGEVGSAKLSALNDLRAMEAGLLFVIKEKIRLGGTYGNWGKSLTLKNKIAGTKQKAEYWTLGAGYEYEKIGASLTYMQSEKAGGVEALKTNTGIALVTPTILANSDLSDFRTNRLRNIVLDVDYKLAPGFLPYVGISSFEFKESTGGKDKGFVLMGGTRLLF